MDPADRPAARDVAHAGPMAPDTSPLDPGSMTVPPLFGWQHIVAVLALMAVVHECPSVWRAPSRTVRSARGTRA